MSKRSLIILLTFVPLWALSQVRHLDLGLGARYDHFTIRQPENLFHRNVDLGAQAYISYGQPFKKDLSWEAGLATSNYKLNLRLVDEDGFRYSNRELISVMRSNRLFVNLIHETKTLNERWTWYNSAGVSLLIGNKNPYDVILERSRSVETTPVSKSVLIRIQTFGLTGSAILVNAQTGLFCQLREDMVLRLQLGLVSGMGEVSRVEINYVTGSSSQFKKAIFTTNGLSTSLTIGLRYIVNK